MAIVKIKNLYIRQNDKNDKTLNKLVNKYGNLENHPLTNERVIYRDNKYITLIDKDFTDKFLKLYNLITKKYIIYINKLINKRYKKKFSKILVTFPETDYLIFYTKYKIINKKTPLVNVGEFSYMLNIFNTPNSKNFEILLKIFQNKPEEMYEYLVPIFKKELDERRKRRAEATIK